MESGKLIAGLREARERQLSLFDDLEGEQLFGAEEHHLEPPIWEMGHVAWFQELYLLRGLDKREPILERGDSMYDSFRVSYKLRWSHDFPGKAETLDYAAKVLERSVARLEGREPTSEECSLYLLVIDHETMHTENLMAVRQHLGWPPAQRRELHEDIDESYRARDIEVPGGTFLLGARRDQGHVLDNEMWEHPVEIEPFRISSLPVTQGEYAELCDAGGYTTRSLWNKDGWNWRRRQGIEGPLYWKKIDGVWHERQYASWTPIRTWHPMCHINLHEARAYCRFAKRRLPTEAEWEMAASWDPRSGTKTIYPWGDEPPTPARVHMDLASGGSVDVRAKAHGDSHLGCRQMIGNVWEWTSSKLTPFPGFAPGAYRDYSLPYLDKKPVLRGGAWSTSPGLIRNTWRNFFIRHRRNIFAGMRTCAPSAKDA